MVQDGSTVHTHRNHLIRNFTKEPFLYPHLHNFIRFQTQFNMTLQNQLKMLRATHFHLIPF